MRLFTHAECNLVGRGEPPYEGFILFFSSGRIESMGGPSYIPLKPPVVHSDAQFA